MTFWEITRKDLILLRRDMRALFVLLAFPLLFIMIIGSTTGKLLGWKAENQILKLGFVNRIDYEEIADKNERQELRNIVTAIVNRIQRRTGFRIRKLDETEYREFIDEGKVDDKELNAVLIFGSEFQNRLNEINVADVLTTGGGRLAAGLGSLGCRLDTRLKDDSSTRSIIESTLFGDVVETIRPYVLCRKLSAEAIAADPAIQKKCQALKIARGKPLLKLLPEKKSREKKDGKVYQDLIPSYTVMFVFFLVNIMARSFLHERDLGTLRRLRLAPISTLSLVVGKTVPFLILSLVQSVLLFLCGPLFFGMSWGPMPAMLLPVIFCTSLSATGLGLVVATIVRSESQVSAYANILVITMAGISGCFMPREWLPEKMQTISLATPHAWSLMSYEQLLKHDAPDVSIVLMNCGVLLLFSVLFFAFGCNRFRRFG